MFILHKLAELPIFVALSECTERGMKYIAVKNHPAVPAGKRP